MILMFDSSMHCALVCSALSDPAKRRVLEALSRGPLTLEALAAVAGVSDVLVKDIVSEMESAGLTKMEEVEERGVKRVFVRALSPMYYEGDINGLEGLVKEASNEILNAFLSVIERSHRVLEVAFNKNEARYTLSSLIAYCFAAAFREACKELNEERMKEDQEVMRVWIREEVKSRSKKEPV
ncbi:MAG: winged helix-turn-helix domain-containing protein [Candidatus Nezhaarchaeota archaeon]|nr:winged helix-turn-helix domain-containing protein [Candidatus Nezhaarchaeota archaeon]MCX8141673.1 winged helix-turn-helix domain-containing protein [Candidatus Nezhaarchaeota archaeon]MDW8049940.1 winged helix-turn-helix domain-containing protein [Nitrososphaerota archaeon]